MWRSGSPKKNSNPANSPSPKRWLFLQNNAVDEAVDAVGAKDVISSEVPSGGSPVRGAGQPLPEKLAVRGPAGSAARPVPSGPHATAYDGEPSGGVSDATGRLRPTAAGRAAYGEKLRDFEPVSDFEAFHANQLEAQPRNLRQRPPRHVAPWRVVPPPPLLSRVKSRPALASPMSGCYEMRSLGVWAGRPTRSPDLVHHPPRQQSRRKHPGKNFRGKFWRVGFWPRLWLRG